MKGSVPDLPNRSSSHETIKGSVLELLNHFSPLRSHQRFRTGPPEPLISKRRPEGFRPIAPEPLRMSTHRGPPSRHSVICWAECANEMSPVVC
ncbi:unnamed protein product [Adineta ricciae]|uniref:Uncharacterized protein n=1 Tax=Adineta ricciae TaxID=249248 RepID=A0A815VNM6_ADIRI|nr:unnamed protein product [Adineta ricciae]